MGTDYVPSARDTKVNKTQIESPAPQSLHSSRGEKDNKQSNKCMLQC